MKQSYYKLQFHNCNLDYNETLVSICDDIFDYLEQLEKGGSITISIVKMTELEFEEWFKANVKP